jgi:8-oxo-dGTP pyrophosphatase MutT (NUDIX family)
MDTIYRHVAACNNAILPGGRLPLLIEDHRAGWLEPALLEPVLALGGERRDGCVAVAADRLDGIARALAAAGHFHWRGEAFDVRAVPDGPVLATLDRGALPSFGVQAVGVHLNALVRRNDGLWLWVARRAPDKLLDPGKLDHLVAGGVPAGLSPMQALLKEGEEEAGLPEALLAGAAHVGVIDYAMLRAEGLRRDRLHCYDVELPEGFVPEARDGEVEGFELWPLAEAVARVRDTDDFKFNVNLVLIELFQRHGLLPGG